MRDKKLEKEFQQVADVYKRRCTQIQFEQTTFNAHTARHDAIPKRPTF